MKKKMFMLFVVFGLALLFAGGASAQQKLVDQVVKGCDTDQAGA